MSVVVYHQGVMYADSRAYAGDTHPIGHKMKIHRLADGSLLGIVSNVVGLPEAFKAWIERGANMDDYMPADPSFEAIHVKLTGEIFYFNDGYTPSGPIVGDQFTIGSGKQYALGAMLAGADAESAVRIAIQCDTWCGAPVTRIPLYEPQAEPAPAPVEPAFDLASFKTETSLHN